MASSSSSYAIDFEVESEWSKCIYSELDRSKSEIVAIQSERNNSSTYDDHIAPIIRPDLKTQINPAKKHNVEGNLRRQTHGVALSLCVRKHNYENYLWQFVHNGVFQTSEAYENLLMWTVILKVRMNRNVPMGCLMRGVQSRLGLKSSDSLKFCLDGFYGMLGCGDVFGNSGGDVVPWMEVSSRATANSLKLNDGDILFVSYANGKVESQVRARKYYLMSRIFRKPGATEEAEKTEGVSSGNNLQRSYSGTVSYNALPLAGTIQPLVWHQSRILSSPQVCQAVVSTKQVEPPRIAAESILKSQLSLTIANPSNSDERYNIVESTVFTVDGSELIPGALERLLQLQSEHGDLFRVRYPGCHSGLGLAMSPDLLAKLLNGLDETTEHGPIVHSQSGLTKSHVFKYNIDSTLANAANAFLSVGGSGGAGVGIGVVEELHRFCLELEAQLKAHCGDQSDVWSVAGTEYFVIDTFFAAAMASIYGTGKEHRFQAYTVNSTLQCIEEYLAITGIDPIAPCKQHLTRVWDLLYSLHPTIRELSSLQPCRHLGRLRDTYRQTSEKWKNFVGISVSLLHEDYSAKKAAFWAINYLVQNRSVYECLSAEIQSSITKTGSEPIEYKQLTLSRIEEMQFLDAFVKEVYRLTSGQFTRFQPNGSFILQAQPSVGFKFRKGSNIAVLLRSLNMNSKYFCNPEVFCPQRFLPGNQDSHLLCLPFGAMSPRRQIGVMKLKLFLILLLGRYSLKRYGPAAQVNSRFYGLDVLPHVEDANFQYKYRL